MTHTPIEYGASLRIGSVDFVAPDQVKVVLEIEAPETVALNAGGPRPFPRVNSYVLIPVDDAYLVGQIEWLTIERSDFPKRRGVRDFGLVDLPYPQRKMSLSPLGTLRYRHGQKGSYQFARGADALPSLGAPVLLPTDEQLHSIVESGERPRIQIGVSPLAGNARVCVDPDRLFGRHLAVLGNTGSGKSCSVAGLIRWSLESARSERPDDRPNARFIVLDPNGEYARAFRDTDPAFKPRVFRVTPGEGENPLRVPLWFWSAAEWVAFSQASARTQKPTLIQALRFVRDGVDPSAGAQHRLRRILRTIVATLHHEHASGTPWGPFPKPKSFFEKLEKWHRGLEAEAAKSVADDHPLAVFVAMLDELCAPRRIQHPHYDFEIPDVDKLLQVARDAHAACGGADEDMATLDADSPRPFEGDALLRSVEATAEMMNVSDYVETLLIRLRTLLGDSQMAAVIQNAAGLTLEGWLEDYVGADNADNGCLAIVDLSLVPYDVVHVVTSVTARMIFQALQRYRRQYGTTLPTVLVMEEAHTFIRRYGDDIESHDASAICCQVFERIAREGRKFGLGLVLSSQRPSELSPTVLSQCNTFLLHRISNDRDQNLVHRFVPDSLRGLLRELPSLPSRQAILLGWASELPVLVRMNKLPREQQPHSDDPDFWDVWTGQDSEGNEVNRSANWKPLADEWQGKRADNDEAG